MARPLRIEYGGAVYHVTIRGNQRGIIFQKGKRDQALDLGMDVIWGRIKGVRYFLGLTLFILHVESLLCRDQKG